MTQQEPDYVIATTELGVVLFQEKEAVGIQFVDTAGYRYFLPLPGSVLPELGKSISDLALKMPAVLQWKTHGS